jgi:ABC-type glycerol-3-phosphate transport system permease component
MSKSIATAARQSLVSQTARRNLNRSLIYAVLIVFCLISMYPLVMMLLNSFKTNDEIFRNPAGWPNRWTLSSYADIVGRGDSLLSNYIVSIVVAIITTVGNVILCGLAGYAFAKFRFRGRNAIFAVLMISVMVPMEIKIPGQYLMYAKVGLLDTLSGIILPKLTAIFGVFLIRQYMQGLPDSVIESARIDGARHWTIYWKIITPMAAPILGAFAILRFMASWNDYLWPSIAIRNIDILPLMVVLPKLTDATGFERVWGTIMAGSVLATLPIIIVFLRFQNKFMSSVTVGAVKG